MQVSAARMAFYMERAATYFFKHKYTWTDIDGEPVLDGMGQPTYDEWNNQIYIDSAPIADKDCLFLWKDVSTQTQDGLVIVKTPTLYVPHDDIIDLGDNIANVLDQSATIILVSAVVESVNTVANFGPSVCKVLTLGGAVTV